MKPVKADFKKYVQLTVNVPDDLINPHIDNAYYYDIKPLLGSLAEDVLNTVSGDVLKPELNAFYTDYLERVWILKAYYRFYAKHGINVTQFGITKTKDPQGTFDQVSAQERANELNLLKSDSSIADTNMYNKLAEVKWMFDNVAYRNMRRPERKFGISAIK